MLATGVVLAAALGVLTFVYGVGFLWFAWWDGGLLRRVLMAAQLGVVGYALYVFVESHRFKF